MSSPVLNYKLESIFIIMYPEGPHSDIDNIILHYLVSLWNIFAFSQNYTTYSHFKYFLLLESIIQFHCVNFACEGYFSYEDQRLRRSKKITMMYHHLSY